MKMHLSIEAFKEDDMMGKEREGEWVCARKKNE